MGQTFLMCRECDAIGLYSSLLETAAPILLLCCFFLLFFIGICGFFPFTCYVLTAHLPPINCHLHSLAAPWLCSALPPQPDAAPACTAPSAATAIVMMCTRRCFGHRCHSQRRILLARCLWDVRGPALLGVRPPSHGGLSPSRWDQVCARCSGNGRAGGQRRVRRRSGLLSSAKGNRPYDDEDVQEDQRY